MTTRSSPVLPAATSDYVLPAPQRSVGEVVVVAPSPGLPAALHRGSEVARVLGHHFGLLAETQQLFLAEMRERLVRLDTAIADDSRAQLKGAVRELLGVMEWADAVQAEMVADGQCAAKGRELIGVAELVEQVAAAAGNSEQPVVVSGALSGRWWGEAGALAEMLRQALHLVAERTQGLGRRRIEVSEVDGAPRLRVVSVGEPTDSVDPETVVRFRRLVDRVGAEVTPDELGPGAAGMSIRLPARQG